MMVSHRTQSKELLRLMTLAKQRNVVIFKGERNLVKALRNMETKFSRQDKRAMNVFYDSFKKEGSLIVNRKPKIRKNIISIEI